MESEFFIVPVFNPEINVLNKNDLQGIVPSIDKNACKNKEINNISLKILYDETKNDLEKNDIKNVYGYLENILKTQPNNLEAKYGLSQILLDIDGINFNHDRGMKYLNQCAKKGYQPAFDEVLSIARDSNDSLTIVKILSHENCPKTDDDWYELAMNIIEVQNDNQNVLDDIIHDPVEIINNLAEKGHIDSLSFLIKKYAKESDFDESLKWCNQIEKILELKSDFPNSESGESEEINYVEKKDNLAKVYLEFLPNHKTEKALVYLYFNNKNGSTTSKTILSNWIKEHYKKNCEIINVILSACKSICNESDLQEIESEIIYIKSEDEINFQLENYNNNHNIEVNINKDNVIIKDKKTKTTTSEQTIYFSFTKILNLINYSSKFDNNKIFLLSNEEPLFIDFAFNFKILSLISYKIKSHNHLKLNQFIPHLLQEIFEAIPSFYSKKNINLINDEKIIELFVYMIQYIHEANGP